MPRLQVLQLPDQDDGPRTVTPFALVVDEVTEDEADRLRRHPAPLTDTGARAVLVFPHMHVEIPDNDTSAFRVLEPVRPCLPDADAESAVQLARESLLDEYGSDAAYRVDRLIRAVRRCYTGPVPAEVNGAEAGAT